MIEEKKSKFRSKRDILHEMHAYNFCNTVDFFDIYIFLEQYIGYFVLKLDFYHWNSNREKK